MSQRTIGDAKAQARIDEVERAREIGEALREAEPTHRNRPPHCGMVNEDLECLGCGVKLGTLKNGECGWIGERLAEMDEKVKALQSDKEYLISQRDRLENDLMRAGQVFSASCDDYARETNARQLAMQDAQAANRDVLLKLATTLERVAELETYKAHHKTCLELAEEVNRDITLERRINASLREKCDQQKQALQGLADALKRMLAVFPPEFGEKWAESSGEKIQVQAWNQARAALEAAAPFLEEK